MQLLSSAAAAAAASAATAHLLRLFRIPNSQVGRIARPNLMSSTFDKYE